MKTNDFNQKPILEVLKPIKQPTNESVCGDFYKELLKEPVYLEDCLGDLQDPTSEIVKKCWEYLSKTDSFSRKNTAVNTAEICEK